MGFIYNIVVRLLILGMKIGRFFNAKIKKGWEGRRQSESILQKAFSPKDKVIWMHAASLGEYEQGLPVLEKLKEQYPAHKILVTFFSPSGYENIAKKEHIADAVCYLPFDDDKSLDAFLSYFSPELFLTVKYDYWYHLFEKLRAQRVPIFVISALFYKKQVFFKPYGKWFVRQLKKNVCCFFHQTEESCTLAKSIGIAQSHISGDTRFDRVKTIRNRNNEVPYITAFKEEKKLVVFGSSWNSEEAVAEMAASCSEAKIIIAPHDLKRIPILKTIFPNALLYSGVNDEKELASSNVLIIDCIGILSKLYAYADIAVVGGGFHSLGLHNILEAATFGIPVVFGNHYKKNPEADTLIKNNGGKAFAKENDATQFVLKLIEDKALRDSMGTNAKNFINSQANATEKVVSFIINNAHKCR